MAVADEPNSTILTMEMMIDEAYEFSAPRFFDFLKGESEEDRCQAELWFDTALTYAPSRMFQFLIFSPFFFHVNF